MKGEAATPVLDAAATTDALMARWRRQQQEINDEINRTGRCAHVQVAQDEFYGVGNRLWLVWICQDCGREMRREDGGRVTWF